MESHLRGCPRELEEFMWFRESGWIWIDTKSISMTTGEVSCSALLSFQPSVRTFEMQSYKLATNLFGIMWDSKISKLEKDNFFLQFPAFVAIFLRISILNDQLFIPCSWQDECHFYAWVWNNIIDYSLLPSFLFLLGSFQERGLRRVQLCTVTCSVWKHRPHRAWKNTESPRRTSDEM